MSDERQLGQPTDFAGAGLPLVQFDGPETGDFEIAAPQFTADAIASNRLWMRDRRIAEHVKGVTDEVSKAIYGEAGPPPAPFTTADMNSNTPSPDEKLFAEMARLKAKMPGEFANFPSSLAEARGQAEATVRRELEEEQADAEGRIANRSNPNMTGAISSFAGSMAAGVTDAEGIATLPFGAGAGSLARTLLIETILGGASGALSLPAYNKQADFLGTERPDPVNTILMGMAFGAALPLAGRALHVGVNAMTPAGRIANRDLLGLAAKPDATDLQRGAGAVLGRQEATLDTAPDGIDPETHAARVDAAEKALLDDAPQTVSTSDVIPDIDMTGPKRAPDPEASPFAAEATARTLDDVTVVDDTSGKTRDKPLSPAFLASLRGSVAPLGDDIGVKIVSGGQDPIGTPGGQRTGSTRHDVDATGMGQTADVVLTRNGQDILPGDDPELYARFLYQAARTYTGIGHYAWGVHVGGGKVASWGPDTTGATLDPYFKQAIDAGRGKPAPKGAPPRFEYEPGGNAAPDANQVGYVFGKLIDKGATPNVAAALVGNLMQESGRGLNTGAIGDGGNSIGMGQWNKSRAVALRDFAEARGTDWRDLDTQIDFLWSELNGSHADALARIMAAPDAATAARIASEEFWRPSQPHLSNRMAYARMIDSQYQSGTVPQGSAPGRWRDPGDDTLANDVHSFQPMDLQFDGAAYQYKMGGDKNGVTDRLLRERVWDAMAAVGVIVHERLDGSRFIADGHQRLGLAQRLWGEGQTGITLQGYLLREADGWSVEDVRAIAALKNIRAETGTPLDAARVMRDSPELVNQIGGRSRPFMAQAQALADLAPGPFQAIVNEVIPQNWGAIVGRVIPDDDQLQGLAIAALKKADPQNEVQAESITRDIRRLGLEARADDAQGSLFGDGFDLRRTVISERAKVIDRVIKDARADRTLFSRLEREADTIEGAGNVLDRSANLTRAELAEQALARVLILADQPGAVRDAIDAAARAVRAGTGLDDAAGLVRDVLAGKAAKDTGGSDAAGSAGRGDAAETLAGISLDEIAARPEVQAALAEMAARPVTTGLPGYGTEDFWAARNYSVKGEIVPGKSAAVAHLAEAARALAWTDEGLPVPKNPIRAERKAMILIGPPASGKSTVANPIARDLGAAIIDADEAKKLIPGYDGGIGANAVHEESTDLINEVLEQAFEKGENILLPKVGGNPAKMDRLAQQLAARGYAVDLVYVDARLPIAAARMIGRFNATGRIIPLDVLKEGVDGAKRSYDLLKTRSYINAFAHIDNTPGIGQPRRIVEDPAQILHALDGRDGPHRDGKHGQNVRADRREARGESQDGGLTPPASAPRLPPPQALDLPPVGDARIERGLFDDPIDDVAEVQRMAALDREFSNLLADPSFDLELPLAAARDGAGAQSQSLRATLDVLRDDTDFVDALRTICFRKGS